MKNFLLRYKKQLGILFFVIVLAIIFTRPGSGSAQYPNFGDMELPTEPLAAKDYEADFEYLFETFELYYPYLDINEELSGVDWLSRKESYRQLVLNSDDQAFKANLELILADLNHEQNQVIQEVDGFKYYAKYRSNRTDNNWQYQMVEVFHQPSAVKRYELTNALVSDYLLNPEHYDQIPAVESLMAVDYKEQQVGYIKLPQNFNYEESGHDAEILMPFLESVKTYPKLIIDLRDNQSTDMRYWQEFFLPKLFSESHRQTIHYYMKLGSLTETVMVQENYELLTDLQTMNPYLQSFTHQRTDTIAVHPSFNTIKYEGEIILLINEQTSHTADALVNFMQENELATTVGTATDGNGYQQQPLVFALPNSGYVIQFARSLSTSVTNDIHLLEKTKPNIELDLQQLDVLDILEALS